MQVELLTRNIAHTNLCGRNIKKNRWSKNKDGTRVLKERKIEKVEKEGSCQACCSKTSQQRSTHERKRMAAETPEEREQRLQPLLKCITRRILYHIETVNYYSILCKIILVQHVNYHASLVQTCTQQEFRCSSNEIRTK